MEFEYPWGIAIRTTPEAAVSGPTTGRRAATVIGSAAMAAKTRFFVAALVVTLRTALAQPRQWSLGADTCSLPAWHELAAAEWGSRARDAGGWEVSVAARNGERYA